MMERHFKGTPPHINIDKIEAEIAFLPGLPERTFGIAEKFSSYEKVTEQREFVTYKGKHGGRECDRGRCGCCGIYLSNHKITRIFTGEQ
jgi:purine-nucleoside phosphorylase